MQPKPVKDVTTFDGKKHEVDIRHKGKSFQAWAFVENQMIEGNCTSTQLAAVTSWQKQYQAAFKAEKAPQVQ